MSLHCPLLTSSSDGRFSTCIKFGRSWVSKAALSPPKLSILLLRRTVGGVLREKDECSRWYHGCYATTIFTIRVVCLRSYERREWRIPSLEDDFPSRTSYTAPGSVPWYRSLADGFMGNRASWSIAKEDRGLRRNGARYFSFTI